MTRLGDRITYTGSQTWATTFTDGGESLTQPTSLTVLEQRKADQLGNSGDTAQRSTRGHTVRVLFKPLLCSMSAGSHVSRRDATH
jgi:hypothetical protein